MKTVEPIRDENKLTEIMEELEHDTTTHGKRIYLLFATMFYTGLRVSDVVKLRKSHVSGEYICTTEQKTGKLQRIAIPRQLRDIYDVRLDGMADDDYLFPSRNRRPDGTQRHITTRDAGYDMKIVQKRFSLNYPFACHSLRKTHGYMRYKKGVSLEILRQHFNHADEATTRRYIGIDEEERNKDLLGLKAGGYTPPKPEKRTIRKGRDPVLLEIERQEREDNGRKWGEAKKEAARRALEEREKKEQKLEQKKKNKSEYDKARYKARKAAEAASKGESPAQNV